MAEASTIAAAVGGITLDADQAEAVHGELDRPLLVLAGPGAGKTRVLTQRIIYLVLSEIALASEVVAITFTNAAVAEMAARVAAELPADKSGVRISTIHALAAQVVRRHPHVVGRNADFSIFDSEEQLTIARAALEHSEIDVDPAELIRKIGTAKANLEDAALWKIGGEVAMAEAFDLYETEMQRANALDFEGLVHAASTVLSYDTIAEGWRSNIRALLVDEFHDVSEAQFALVRLLSPRGIGLTVVADDDQIVYAFRGADPEFTVDFEQYFPGAEAVLLRHNYRSHGGIVDSALRLIDHNEQRRPKQLVAAVEAGPRPEHLHFENEQAEAEAIAAWAEGHIASGGRPGDLGILSRMRGLGVRQDVEIALAARGIRYVTLGERALWERSEVRDTMAWLNLTVNPAHTPAFSRAMKSRQGLGDATVRALLEAARERGISFEAACLSPETAGLSGKRGKAALAFGETMVQIREILSNGARGFAERVGDIIIASEIPKRLEKKGRTGQRQLASVREVYRAASLYEGRCEGEGIEPELSEFLQELSLQSSDRQHGTNAVSLGTIHAVKGLEFRCVWVVGLDEGVMPSNRALREGRIEEERRLCYVAFTRARESLVLSSSARRWRKPAKPSRFISEAGL